MYVSRVAVLKRSYSYTKPKKRFVDWIRLRAIGGNGGHGCMSFRREAHVRFGGPNGGNGGRGGCVIFVANSNIKTLAPLNNHYKARNGGRGKGRDKDGNNGSDMIVKVPVGTVFKHEGDIVADLSSDLQSYTAVRGGDGGVGNTTFASSTHRSPREYTDGEEGENTILELELKTIADIGLVGFPNAGKSTLLRSISRARPEVASYAFTTLNPFVGIIENRLDQHIAVADIPGLLPGAHHNYGLGHAFLRHVERCNILVYVLYSGEEKGRSLRDQLEILQEELSLYEPSLPNKAKLVAVNKMDLDEAEENVREFSAQCRHLPIIPISGLYNWNIEQFKDILCTSYELHKHVKN